MNRNRCIVSLHDGNIRMVSSPFILLAVAVMSGCEASGELAPMYEDCNDGVCIVANGAFLMGCNAGETGCDPMESPRHRVTVPMFGIDQTEVTVAEYRQCVDDDVCTVPVLVSSLCTYGISGSDNLPINCVDWTQAQSYCEWAGGSLCTEAEWEKASRGSDTRPWPWGSTSPNCTMASFLSGGEPGCGVSKPREVGSFPMGASPYGVFNMAGNVAEWVADWYVEGYAGAPTDGSERQTELRMGKVIRGGGLANLADEIRTTRRSLDPPSGIGSERGIRCCY